MGIYDSCKIFRNSRKQRHPKGGCCFVFLGMRRYNTDMQKYLAIVNTYWQRGLAYRFTIIAFRVGEVAEILVLILMWSAIYKEHALIRGFTAQEMITYVLMGNLFQIMVRNFISDFIAAEINEGRLSMFLVKPISYFRFAFSREIGRTSFPTLLSIITQVIVMLFFLDRILVNTDIWYLALIVAMLILAFFSELLLSFLIALVAFWTDEVDGLFRTVERVKRFFSGGYFPLTLLPPVLVQISFLLPFAYSFFIPAQLYLKKIDLLTGLKGLCVQAVWIVLLYGVVRIAWKRGLRRYEGVGM